MAVAPLILAAGASRRMGRPKALLDFDGTPAIRLVLAACTGPDLLPAIVVLGADAETVMRAVPRGVRILVNPDPDRGRTSSVKLAVQAADPKAEAFLIFPVDVPLVPQAVVARLLEARGRAPIVVPSHDRRRGHPVLVDASLRDEILRLGDDEPLREVFHKRPESVLHVNAGTPAVLMDMDTPEDYARALESFRRRS